MKNLQFTPENVFCGILSAFNFIFFFAMAGASAIFFMPWPFEQLPHPALVLAASSVGLATFVWALFRLIRPVHANRRWQIAEIIIVPFCWLLLVSTVDVCLGLFVSGFVGQFYDIS
jgi:hypothetical protein